jgi:putative intracellular protease/amidase
MNGVVIEQMSSLEDAVDADAVIVGSGIATREVVEDATIMNTLRRLDPQRQLIAGQCSGTRSRASSASSRTPANARNTCGTSAVMSRITSTPASCAGGHDHLVHQRPEPGPHLSIDRGP